MFRILLLTVALAGCTTHLLAQERLKLGLGANYISNTYEKPHLYDYLAPSLHLGYKLYENERVGFALENATTFRSSGSSDYENHKFGFTSALQFLANLNVNRVAIIAGSGPAYVRQRSMDFDHNEGASGYYLAHVAGIGFKGKPFLGGEAPTRYQLRITYLKSISQPAYDGGMISFILYLKN